METLWHSMKLHRYFREPHGIPWNSTIFPGIPWTSKETPWNFMAFHGTPSLLHGTPWNSMDTPWILHGTPWHSMELHGYSIDTPWKFRGIPWISIDFHGFPWNSMEFHGGISHGPSRYKRREEREQDEPSKSFCPNEICTNPSKLHIKTRQINSTLWIWRCIYSSEHALSSQSSFSRPAAFKTGHAFVNLHPNRRKKIQKCPIEILTK